MSESEASCGEKPFAHGKIDRFHPRMLPMQEITNMEDRIVIAERIAQCITCPIFYRNVRGNGRRCLPTFKKPRGVDAYSVYPQVYPATETE